MATKTQVRRALAKQGGTWDERYDCLDAPTHRVWRANQNHSIAVVYELEDGQTASDRWEYYLEIVRSGTEPCTDPDCDHCAEVG